MSYTSSAAATAGFVAHKAAAARAATVCLDNNPSSSFLEQARKLKMPTREQMLRRDPSIYEFWGQNEKLLEMAWEEWEKIDNQAKFLPPLDESMYHPDLCHAIQDAWNDPTPTNESRVRDLWKEVSPGVYQCQFFDPKKIGQIRDYFEKAANAGIPTRPPHGIVLNRKGFMIDPRSNGYMAIPSFQTFYRDLIDTYMRPLGRLFYPDYITQKEDSESFAFSIQYQPDKDYGIQQHTDASSLTLNINLNIPKNNNNNKQETDNEGYTGSALYFVDPHTGKKNLVEFAPGVAVMHRGCTAHAALPITSGERTNLVLWLYGKQGHTNRYYPYDTFEQLTAQERWSKPVSIDPNSIFADTWSPF